MIIFHHIPRTAGMFVEQQIVKRVHVHRRVENLIFNIAQGQFEDVDFLSGHFSLFGFERKPEDFLFTFFRNPVERVYSLYHHASQNLLKGNNLAFNRLKLDYPAFKKLISQGLPYFIDKLIEGNGQLYLQNRVKLIDEVSNGAYENWPLYDFVGVQEQMDDSMAVLGNKLNLDLSGGQRTNASCGTKESYRREDLERLFIKETQWWEIAKTRLKNQINLLTKN